MDQRSSVIWYVCPGFISDACSREVAVAHAKNAFRDILREAIRRNIDQFAGEIRIHRRRLHEQTRTHRPSDFQILR